MATSPLPDEVVVVSACLHLIADQLAGLGNGFKEYDNSVSIFIIIWV